MHNLLVFLSRHNHWLIFLLLETLSGIMLFRYNSYQGSVWFSSANKVAGVIYKYTSSVQQYFSLAELNSQLTSRNVALEHQVERLSEELTKATRDTTMAERIQLDVMKDTQTIPAKVISASFDKLNNFITIDKGSADGIQKDMGVVCGTGVVGIVYLTSEHYSVIIPVLSGKSAISCTIRGKGHFGYLHWNGGSPQHAYVDDIPRHAHFKKGDYVVTSGYSDVFPPGILVGRIDKVYNSDNGMSYRLKVSLSTDFSRLRDVCVINDPNLSISKQLINAAKDSLKIHD